MSKDESKYRSKVKKILQKKNLIFVLSITQYKPYIEEEVKKATKNKVLTIT